MSHFLDRLTFFKRVTEPFANGHGIMTGEDALEFFVAGASAVAVGIASSIHPTAIARITAEIADYLTAHKLPSTAALKSR